MNYVSWDNKTLRTLAKIPNVSEHFRAQFLCIWIEGGNNLRARCDSDLSFDGCASQPSSVVHRESFAPISRRDAF
jgi:hypothetical protein